MQIAMFLGLIGAVMVSAFSTETAQEPADTERSYSEESYRATIKLLASAKVIKTSAQSCHPDIMLERTRCLDDCERQYNEAVEACEHMLPDAKAHCGYMAVVAYDTCTAGCPDCP